MHDLENGIIRTPLRPLETLLDDPLRLLRVIRFATRFQYTIDDALFVAMHDDSVRKAFIEKVSRERVGIEIEKIFAGPHAMSGFHLLVHAGLHGAVFMPPRGYENPLVDPLPLLELVPQLFPRMDLFGMLAVAVLPFWDVTWEYRHRPEPVVAYIVRESLKLSNRHVQHVLALTQHAPLAMQVIQGARDPVLIGKLVAAIGPPWQQALKLALLRAVYEGQSALRDLSPVFGDIEAMGLHEAHSMKPLVDGATLQTALRLDQGPQVGRAQTTLRDWQYRHPCGTAEEALAYLRKTHS